MNQLRSWLYGRNDAKHIQVASEPKTEANVDKVNEDPGNSLKRLILKVIPLVPGDCLECKLIGSGVMILSGIIVIVSAVSAPTRPSLPHKYLMDGQRKSLYYSVCGGLFLALETAAVCRLFDLGPFDKSRVDSTKR